MFKTPLASKGSYFLGLAAVEDHTVVGNSPYSKDSIHRTPWNHLFGLTPIGRQQPPLGIMADLQG
jgi:hypothetical protein